MSAEVSLPSAQDNNSGKENKFDAWRRFFIALLFLLFSFIGIFLSSQTALLLIGRDWLDASMTSSEIAEYGSETSLAMAPMSGDIASEVARDEDSLSRSQGPLRQGELERAAQWAVQAAGPGGK